MNEVEMMKTKILEGLLICDDVDQIYVLMAGSATILKTYNNISPEAEKELEDFNKATNERASKKIHKEEAGR